MRNRVFLDDAATPVCWSVVNDNGSAATIALDSTNSFNDKLTTSLRLTVTKAAKDHPAGVANGGYCEQVTVCTAFIRVFQLW